MTSVMNRVDADHKPKFRHIPTDAKKEILNWASEGVEVAAVRQGFVRNSGQLADNVTEQRQLETYIMELSRERYKFMSKSKYERMTFVERQRRKSAVFRELLRNVTTGGRQTRASRCTKVVSHDVMPEMCNCLSQMCKQTLPSPQASNDMCASANDARQAYITTAIPLPSRASTRSIQLCRLPDVHNGVRPTTTTTEQLRNPATLQSRRLTSTKTPVSDSRYRRLRSALCNNYVIKADYFAMPAIIQSVDSLHVVSKSQTVSIKSQLAQKFLQMMAEHA